MKKNYTMKLAVPVEKTINKLEEAWSLRFANQTFSGFCNNVCKGRYAGHCESCPVYQAYELAKQQIKDGVRSRPEYQDCKINSYGAFRHFDGKGHKTEVWRAPLKKEVK
jgi:hypothetical protein